MVPCSVVPSCSTRRQGRSSLMCGVRGQRLDGGKAETPFLSGTWPCDTSAGENEHSEVRDEQRHTKS